MSMRGNLISKEYQRMIWVRDESGKEFACYAEDVKDVKNINDQEKSHCLDISQVIGDSW